MKRLALIVALFPSALFAGPDKTTQHLMNDPLTMMDFGLYQIRETLRQSEMPDGSAMVGGAAFDWDGNRIRIERFQYANTSVDFESACAEWISTVRQIAGVNRDTGAAFAGYSNFARYFDHISFNRLNAPEGWQRDLDKLFELKCASYSITPEIIITAPLLGKTYSVERIMHNVLP